MSANVGRCESEFDPDFAKAATKAPDLFLFESLIGNVIAAAIVDGCLCDLG